MRESRGVGGTQPHPKSPPLQQNQTIKTGRKTQILGNSPKTEQGEEGEEEKIQEKGGETPPKMRKFWLFKIKNRVKSKKADFTQKKKRKMATAPVGKKRGKIPQKTPPPPTPVKCSKRVPKNSGETPKLRGDPKRVGKPTKKKEWKPQKGGNRPKKRGKPQKRGKSPPKKRGRPQKKVGIPPKKRLGTPEFGASSRLRQGAFLGGSQVLLWGGGGTKTS